MPAKELIDTGIALASGLGIFLFGMFLMEEAIRMLAGGALQGLISKFTRGRFRSVLTGTIATAILQSSSAVTLMLLAFTGAGIITLADSIGIILGANLGTTFTAWIVAVLGFKIQIESFAIPLAGLGGLGLIFTGNRKQIHLICKIIAGFGFLFLGIDLMKNAMEFIATGFDPLLLQHWGGWAFVLSGFFLSVAVQSSSAAMAIALSIAYTGMFSLHEAFLVVVGTNMGTTVTVVIGAIGGQTVKKQVALSHFVFNIATGFFVWLILAISNPFVSEWLELHMGRLNALALFHTLFNVFGILLFLPFVTLLASFVKMVFPTEASVLNSVPSEIPEAALHAWRIRGVFYHNQIKLFIQSKTYPNPNDQGIELLENELAAFAGNLKQNSVSESQSQHWQHLILGVRATLIASQLTRDALNFKSNPPPSESMLPLFDKIDASIYTILESIPAKVTEKDWTELRKAVRQEDLRLLSEHNHWLKSYPDFSPEEATQLSAYHRYSFQSLLQWLRAGKEFSSQA